ncbi:hypothetical protein AVEN_193096-1 [Araneus ventricosus]|uniref:Uncharacterized protein n=1 Tax=Araneus ventricosus TaxID=182803 RepID=A0A4Y2B1B1_ARAVE|nr:hypothetical protein AVEN_193096-1 [Araneus ventricosus]
MAANSELARLFKEPSGFEECDKKTLKDGSTLMSMTSSGTYGGRWNHCQYHRRLRLLVTKRVNNNDKCRKKEYLMRKLFLIETAMEWLE